MMSPENQLDRLFVFPRNEKVGHSSVSSLVVVIKLQTPHTSLARFDGCFLLWYDRGLVPVVRIEGWFRYDNDALRSDAVR